METLAPSPLTAPTLALADSALMEPANTDALPILPTHSRLLLAVMLVKKALTALMLALADFALTALANTDAQLNRSLIRLTSWELLVVMPAPSQLIAPMPAPVASALMAPVSTDVPLMRSRDSPNSLPS